MLTAWRLTALVPVVVVMISAPAAAQSFLRSLISVTTQDAQGGVIPGATVVLTNTATNERREGVTGKTARIASSTSCPAGQFRCSGYLIPV